MTDNVIRQARTRTSLVWLLLLVSFAVPRWVPAQEPKSSPDLARALLRHGDRVAWMGSSSTQIGVWPRTMEFLLRTRYPNLELQFKNDGVGGATFPTALEKIDGWCDAFHPTVIFFNFGANDAGKGEAGLPAFQESVVNCVARVRAHDARVVFISPQAADSRKSGAVPAANRALYAESLLSFGRERGWPVIDIHHSLESMQKANEEVCSEYTILKDTIHLTDAGYVAWGFFLFDRLELPFACSRATLAADGRALFTTNCTIQDVSTIPDGKGISFTRHDAVLPILPPGPLPPRYSVPLEAYSCYLLKVVGLEPGDYDIACEGKLLGTISANRLGVGVNLNSPLLEAGREAPWSSLARAIWDGNSLDSIGRTAWRFDVLRHGQ